MPMTIVVTRDVAQRIRGFLASSMLEIAPGVYSGPRMSAGVRERVWTVLAGWHGELVGGSILMTWPDKESPGGQAIRTLGTPAKEIVRHDGMFLVRTALPPPLPEVGVQQQTPASSPEPIPPTPPAPI